MGDKVLCEMQDLVNIADAVRSATGSTDSFNVSQMSTRASTIISSGGAISHADWNVNDETDLSYIYNRTHYEAPPSFEITWDGVIGDRFALDMSMLGFDGLYFVKIDDRVPTLEEMVDATITDCYGDSQDEIEINAERCDAYHYPGVYDVYGYVIVCYDADALSAALGFPSGFVTNGIYFSARPDEERYISRFVGRDNSKKLDTKYLPEGYPYETEPKFNIIWNGDMTGRTILDMTSLGYEGVYFVKVSDIVLSQEEVLGALYCYNWNYDGYIDSVSEFNINETYPGTYDIGTEIVVVHDQATLNTALGLPEGYLTNGLYFQARPADKAYIARFTGKSEVKKLDGKYVDLEDMGFSAVATSGNYYDLSNRPDIYTDVVRYNTYQNLSSTGKYISRTNIDVYSKSEVDTKIANLDVNVDMSEYAKTEDLSEYAKTEDLSEYAKTEDLCIINKMELNIHEMPTSYQEASVFYGDKFIIARDNGSYYSNDGIKWYTMPQPNSINTVCYGNGIYVGVRNYTDISGGYTTTIMYSLDGINWNKAFGRPSNAALGVVYTEDKFIIVLNSGSVLSSVDGIIWDEIYKFEIDFSGIGSSMAIIYAFGKIYAQETTRTRYTRIESNDGGLTWNIISRPNADNAYFFEKDICYENEIVVTVGKNEQGGAIKYSKNLNTWMSVSLPYAVSSIEAVCYGNDKFVALSANEGVIFYSIDGIAWNFTTIPEWSGKGVDICYGDGKFVAISTNKYFYSFDGINWISKEIIQNSTNITNILASTIQPYLTLTASDIGAQPAGNYLMNENEEIILKSPNGSLWGVTVSDDGTLTTTAK